MPVEKFPSYYLPMLACTAPRPFNDDDWQFEVKWDGFRMMAYKNGKQVNLRSRNNKDYTNRFQIVADELAKWKHDAVIDGEMVVLADDGRSHFNSLENWYSLNDGVLRYYVFDLVYLDGKSLDRTANKKTGVIKKTFSQK